MTYTTDQVVQLAQEIFDGDVWWRMNPEQTAAFANKVREQTLLEAAEYVSRNLMSAREYAEELRRMAEE